MADRIGGGNKRIIQKVTVRENGWTLARRKLFLDHLAMTCNVAMATNVAGMRGKSAYTLRRSDPVFAGLWKDALTLGYERLEELLLQHALEGVNAIVIGDDDFDDRRAAADARSDSDAGATARPIAPPEMAEPEMSATGTSDAPTSDPSSDGPVRGHAIPGSGIPPLRMAPGDVQLALALLNRHRASVEGRGKVYRGPRPATAAETNAVLRKQLDMLARRKIS